MNPSKTPLIFDIKRYAINDGPGIRITIFFKGCPLSCVWCHNPEGIAPEQEVLFTPNRCIACNSCIETCPHGALKVSENSICRDSEKCTDCATCADNCPSKSREKAGTYYTTDELLNIILREQPFFDHSEGGGVTICGGEPMLYPDYLAELLTKCRQTGIHTAVDTTLFTTTDQIDKILPYTNLFLVDLKHMDSATHRQYTGVPNEPILDNIRYLAKKKVAFRIRIPLIEHINASKENITAAAQFLSQIGWKEKIVDLLPYHDIAVTKHTRRGTRYNPEQLPMEVPSQEKIRETIEIFEQYGISARAK